MARKNRIVLKDAVYHITSRVAHGAFLFSDPVFKDRIAEWIHGAAEFSGVEVYAWCIMDNHFHLVVHVPGVPEGYWTDPGREPDSQAFGMRPAECRVPRWTPASGDCPHGDAQDGGDSPRNDARGHGDSCGDSPQWGRPARPEAGFTLSDEEMLGRLLSLYGDEGRVERLRKAWAEMRAEGNGAVVDTAKERYTRRMYNVSQFVKTVKERVAMVYNRLHGHEGAVWQGRFHSTLVEDAAEVRAIFAAYDDYNPVRAGVVGHPSAYRWCSFGAATGDGPHAERSRRGYEKLLGRPWVEAREVMEGIFALKDAGISHPEGSEDAKTNTSVAIRSRVPEFTFGVYVGRDSELANEVIRALPQNFPGASLAAAVEKCGRFVWDRVA